MKTAPVRVRARPMRQDPQFLPRTGKQTDPRNNLPPQLTSFVGRDHEVGEARRLLQSGRLLTLTGAGGVGKTRLALQAAAETRGDYAQGTWFVDLAAVVDGELAPRAVSAALGIRARPRQSVLDSIIAHLKSRQVLLILDNCEHIVDACADLAAKLLQSCSSVHLLATSREPLRVAGEVIWRVPSLALPDPRRNLPLSELLAYPAVQLFVERARASQPSLTLTPADAEVVVAICARLDGLPLAVELAAARVRTLGLAQILERLDDSFRLLIGGSRTAPRRQQTLRATLDWSTDLLSLAERVVFHRLSVFSGGFTLEAAEHVCAGGPVDLNDALELVTGLVDKSVVITEQHGGKARFRLLEPIRQYAYEGLLSSGELAGVRERHARFFLVFAERWDRGTSRGGVGRQAAWEALEQEHPNLREALNWCLETENPQVGLRLGQALVSFWRGHGHFNEGLKWLTQLLVLPSEEMASSSPRALALLGAGRIARLQGDHALAQALYAEGVPLARQAEEPWVRWTALSELAYYELDLGDWAAARLHFTDAIATARGAHDRASEAISLNYLSVLAYWETDIATARSQSWEAASLARAVGDTWVLAFVLCTVASTALYDDDLAMARSALHESLDLFQQAEERWGTAIALEALGYLCAAEQKASEAAARFAESLAIRRELGDRAGIAASLEGLAAVAAQTGRQQQALLLAGAAESLREAVHAPMPPVGDRMRDRWLVPLRQALGDEVAAAAWAQGRALAPERAMALASVEVARPDPTQGQKAAESPTNLLTRREQEVAVLLTRGLSNRQIAEQLVITERTAAAHIEHILRKLGFASRHQVGTWAAEHGLFS